MVKRITSDVPGEVLHTVQFEKPPKPDPPIVEFNNDFYQGKIEWNGYTTGILYVTVHKDNDPFSMIELVEAVMTRLSKTWTFFVNETKTINRAKPIFKQILQSTRATPDMNRFYGDDSMRNLARSVILSGDQYRKLGRMVMFLFWTLCSMFYSHCSDARSLLNLLKPESYKFEGEVNDEEKKFGEFARWLDKHLSETVDEIRNLHLYDKIDSTSQAAGESAIGQTVSPQPVSVLNLSIRGADGFEKLMKAIESQQGRVLIKNLNIIKCKKTEAQPPSLPTVESAAAVN
jgi:hypothetical protein